MRKLYMTGRMVRGVVTNVIKLSLIIAAVSGCTPMARVNVVSYCQTAWFMVSHREANGHLVVDDPHLEAGRQIEIEYLGVSGQDQKLQILADGYDQATGEPLGRVVQNIWIYPRQGELTAPRNTYSWALYCEGQRVHWSDDFRDVVPTGIPHL